MEQDYAMLACGANQVDVWLAFLAGLTLGPLITSLERWRQGRKHQAPSQP